MSWKKSLLVIYKVWRMFVNILKANDKCFLLNRDNLRQPIQMQLSEKKFLNFFLQFWNLYEMLNIFEKKMILMADVFPKLRTRKRWLNKSLKSPVSEDSSTSNMVRGTKNCWNLNHTTFTIIVDHRESNWVGKIVS